MKNITAIVWVMSVSAVLVVALSWLAFHEPSDATLMLDENGEVKSFSGPFLEEEKATINLNPMEKSNENNPIAVFATSAGVIEIELYRDQMPITVENFVKLATEGFYDGTKFHRVIEGFMVQAGDPNSKGDDSAVYGTGGPGYTIQDEFVVGEELTNTIGSIAMANTGQPNSGGSQFFINTANNTFLDFDKEPLTSRHPVFGRVISGMEIVQAIEGVATNERDLPLEPVVIQSITLK